MCYTRVVTGVTVEGMTTGEQTAIETDALGTVRRAAAAYHKAERGSTATRSALRHAMAMAVDEGESVTDVAREAGVPRIAVYRALGRL